MVATRMRAEVSERLEQGRSGPVSGVLSAAWGRIAARTLIRPQQAPAGTAVICVGGATLGGSGKTQVAIACARVLAQAGRHVVFVGHGYRGRRRKALRVVTLTDRVEDVGDEALVSAQALGADVTVVMGPRQEALDRFGAADAIVLDGPLRIRGPCLSILAVDARAPWGSNAHPPLGDLRAPREALLACADHVVEVDATPAAVRDAHGRNLPLSSLLGRPLGLFTALARPSRLIERLRDARLDIAEIIRVGDHGPASFAVRTRIERLSTLAWIATEKCALHLRPATRVLELVSGFELPQPLAAIVRKNWGPIVGR